MIIKDIEADTQSGLWVCVLSFPCRVLYCFSCPPIRMFQPLALVYQRLAGCHMSSFSPVLMGKVLGWSGCGPRYHLCAPVPAGHHICYSSAAGVHASLFTHTSQQTNWTGHTHTQSGTAGFWIVLGLSVARACSPLLNASSLINIILITLFHHYEFQLYGRYPFKIQSLTFPYGHYFPIQSDGPLLLHWWK